MPHPYLFDMAIHHVDMLRMITGAEVAEVDARSWGAPDGPFKHDPTVQALLTLDDGTAVSYDGTWAEPLSQTSWNGDWSPRLGRSAMVGRRRRRCADAARPPSRAQPAPGAAGAAGADRPVLAELRRALAWRTAGVLGRRHLRSSLSSRSHARPSSSGPSGSGR
jgi:hypothetical protein